MVGPQEAGARVTLAVDELLVVQLEGRASTGYSWQVERIDNTVLALAGREQDSSSQLGGVDVQRLLFKGIASGATSIGLVYRRPWQAPAADDPRYVLDVAVAGPYTGTYSAPQPVQTKLAYQATGAYPARYNACDPGDGSYSRCTAPKDQKSTNACWAFATVAVFENILQLKNPSTKHDLSEQYIVSCNVDGYTASNGGYEAFNMYVNRFKSPDTQAGAVYESEMPWTGRDGSCGSQAHPHHEKLESFTSLGQDTQASVDTLKAAIQAHGPVWTGVCADASMQRYDGKGILRDSCSQPNHAVVLVGWDDNNGDGYWYMRNSWGATTGDRGHVKIAYGASGIGTRSTYVVYDSGVNTPPVANAGASRTVRAGASVTLDGSASSDSDGSITKYAWVQASGSPTVTLSGATTAKATFTAPSSKATLGFTLTVTDDAGATHSASVTITADPAAANSPPIAEAGAAQTVSPGDAVTLDGSGSTDPDGTVASYAWTQTAGDKVTLTGATTARPSFTAPDVSSATTLTFSLTVKDDAGASATDTVDVTVEPSSSGGLVAEAGDPKTVERGAMVQLDGTRSSAPIGDFITTYEWAQTGGPSVQLGGWGPMASFTAPDADATLTFSLTVAGLNGATARDTVEITVGGGSVTPTPNQPPTAEAGPAQTVRPGATVQLDGSGSSDADGAIVGWAWSQTSGTRVALAGADTARPTFTAPSDGGTLELLLVVTDDAGATGSAPVTITVVDPSAPVPDPVHLPSVDLNANVKFSGCSSTGTGLGAGSLSLLATVLAWPRRRVRVGKRDASASTG